MSRLFWLLMGFGLSLFAVSAAQAQTLTTYTSLTSYNAALPATGVVNRLETFSAVATNFAVSQTTPNNWNGFTLSATGTSPYGSSQYCVNLRNCLNWITTPPTTQGVYAAVDSPFSGNGTLRFALTGKAFAFGVDHWDWNDGGQRSEILVTLSNGATFVVNGPTTVSGAPGGFVGFRIDTASIYAGITIAQVTWRNIGFESEIIGLKNVRVAEAAPILQVSNSSQVWVPSAPNPKALPGNEIMYQIDITNSGLGVADSDSMFIVDAIAPHLSFWNGDIDAGGADVHPITATVGFFQSNGAAMSFNPATDIRYSTAATAPTSFAQCATISMDNSFRPDIKFLCVRPTGSLTAGASVPRVVLKFRANIK